MHGFLSGLMGIFMSIGSLFHGGAASTHTPMNVQANGAVQQASSSGSMGRGRFMMKLPAGERRFFGTVTSVNGSSLTIQMMRGMRRGKNTTNMTVNTTTTPQSITVTLDSSTKYVGGSQSDITTNTRVAGVGKTNSDNSLTAVTVNINPTMPSGMPRRGGQGRGPQQ